VVSNLGVSPIWSKGAFGVWRTLDLFAASGAVTYKRNLPFSATHVLPASVSGACIKVAMYPWQLVSSAVNF
jgi:hypothetical protein